MLEVLKQKEVSIIQKKDGIFDNFYLKYLLDFQSKAMKLLIEIDKDHRFDREQIVEKAATALKSQLMDYCSNVLIEEFQIWKATQTMKEGLYEAYDLSLLNSNTHAKILSIYPVMNTLIQRSIKQLLSQLEEVTRYLYKDWYGICEKFGLSMQYLHQIDSLNSDSHNDGRRALILTFDKNQKLVYKPHTLCAEASFNHLLHLVNKEKSLLCSLKNAQVWDRKQYGWQEYIAGKTCRSKNEITRYFYRMGAYSAIFTLLQTSDLHYENIIAQGEYPMFIDLETLVSVLPTRARTKEQTIVERFYQETNISVMASMLFPQKMVGNMLDIDLSGLTGGEENSQTIYHSQVMDRGTDQIRIGQKLYVPEKGKNKVTLASEIIEPVFYTDEILQGAEDCFNLLLNKKEKILEQLEAGALLYGEFRQVLRPTHVYAKYLESSYQPAYLVDQKKIAGLFNIITESTVSAERNQLEYEAMLNNDIPYFTCAYDQNILVSSSHKEIANYFEISPKELVIKKVKQLNKDYIKKQQHYIRLSMKMYAQNHQLADKINLLDGYQQEDLNTSLIQMFKNTALWTDTQEKCTWMLLDRVDEGLVFSPLTPSFYSNAGIIWYLAVSGKVLNDLECTDLAKAAVKGLSEFHQLAMTKDSVSAYAGKYSSIYLYYNLGILWKDETLLYQAYRWIEELTQLDQEFFEAIDYVNGIAGMIHLLTSIYNLEKKAFILEAAVYLAKYLFEKVNASQQNSGLAHGYSGYALAFAGLWSTTGDSQYKEIVFSLIEREDQLFDKKNNNWIDCRDNQSVINYWCYGALGIILARSQIAHLLAEESILSSEKFVLGVQKVIASLQRQKNMGLCHGYSGNIEGLGVIAHHTKSAVLKTIHQEQLERFKQEASLNMIGQYKDLTTMGMMLGLTGVGYELLRNDELQMPSILDLSILQRNGGD